MDIQKLVWRNPTRSLGERARSLLCGVGTVAELVIAAGGDGIAEAGVVPMCGLRTGLAIVGWWLAATLVGLLIDEMRGLPIWAFGRGDCRSLGWTRLRWMRILMSILAIAGVVAFRFWMPLPVVVQIQN